MLHLLDNQGNATKGYYIIYLLPGLRGGKFAGSPNQSHKTDIELVLGYRHNFFDDRSGYIAQLIRENLAKYKVKYSITQNCMAYKGLISRRRIADYSASE